MSLMALLGKGIDGDTDVFIEVLLPLMMGIMTVVICLESPVKKRIHPVQLLWFVDLSDGTWTGVLVDKRTYGPCITMGGLLWSTGNSLREKLLRSLVSAIAAWICISHNNWVAFCQSLAFILLFL